MNIAHQKKYLVFVDFHGALDSYTGIPLCTKNDVIALAKAGCTLTLWIRGTDEKNKVQEWVKREERITNPHQIHILTGRPKNSLLWLIQLIRFPLNLGNFDFYYFSLFPGVRFRGLGKRILRVHDPYSKVPNRLVTFFEEKTKLKLRFAKLLRLDAFLSVLDTANLVFNSQFTATRVLQIYQPRQFSSVIYNLVQFHSSILEPKTKDNSFYPYFIFVGGQRQRKDPVTIINIWASGVLCQKVNFIVVGSVPEHLLSREAIHARNEGKLRFLENIDGDDLRILIENSVASIFYSFGEGWGQPIAESLACGKRVVCNDLEVFREVANGWANYFPTYRPREIEPILLDLLSRAGEVNSETSKIRAFSKRYQVDSLSKAWLDMFDNVHRSLA